MHHCFSENKFSSFLIFPYFIQALNHIAKTDIFSKCFIRWFDLFDDFIDFFSLIFINFLLFCVICWKWFLSLVFTNPFLSLFLESANSKLLWLKYWLVLRFEIVFIHFFLRDEINCFFNNYWRDYLRENVKSAINSFYNKIILADSL